MPRRSTSTASKEAAANSKTEKAEQETPRRSGRAVAKGENSETKEGGRSRRSSTAAQTAASVAESRVTRSRTSVVTRRSTSSPSGSSSSKSGKEAGLESPASRVRSSRRSTGRVNYKESDGEEESRTRKKPLDQDEVEEDYNESAGEEEMSRGSSKRRASQSADKETPSKGKAKSERMSSRTQNRNKNAEDEEKGTPSKKRKDSESLDDTNSSTSTRRSTRARQSSETPANKGTRRSSRGSGSQPASAQRKRLSRGKPEPDADEETEDIKSEQEDEEVEEESHSEAQEVPQTSDENVKKRKLDSDAEDSVDSNQKKAKLDSDAQEESTGDESSKEVGGAEKSPSAAVEEKQGSTSTPEKEDAEIKEDSVDLEKDVSAENKEESDDEPMEVDQSDSPIVIEASSAADDKSDSPEVIEEKSHLKSDEPSTLQSKTSDVSKDDQCIEIIEEKLVSKDKSEPIDVESMQTKEDEVIDIASESEENDQPPSLEKKTKLVESSESSQSAVLKPDASPPVHVVDDKSDESSSPTAIQCTDIEEKVLHIIDKTDDAKSTSSGTEKETDKSAEISSSDRQPSLSESLQGGQRSTASTVSAKDVECVNVPDETNKTDSDVSCLESPENTNPSGTENSSATLPSHEDKESSLNGVNSNSEDSVKSVEIVGDGTGVPSVGGKESSVDEHTVPKANGAHDSIPEDGVAQEDSVLVSSSRRYVFNSSLKEDMRSSLKDKTFEFASYNLGGVVEDGSSQKDELITELNKLKADVICLQEVSKHLYEEVLKPRLDALGYSGTLSVPEESCPGVASFHKSTVFRLVRHSEASLQKLIEKDLEASSLESSDKTAVHSYVKKCGNVLFTQYSPIKGENTLTVANVSMPSSDISTHALQMSCLVRELVTVVEGASKPLLLCGTFNMSEGEAPYQLLRDGYLSNDMIEELQRKKDVILPGKENAALVNLLWKAFQHPSSSLCSCYASVLGRELSVPGAAKPTSPDLLWFSSDCLHTVGVLDIVPSSFEGRKDHHIALKATVAFSN